MHPDTRCRSLNRVLLKKPVESFCPLLHQDNPLNGPISILSHVIEDSVTRVLHLHYPPEWSVPPPLPPRPPQLLKPLSSHIDDLMSSSISQPLTERTVWANIHLKALFYFLLLHFLYYYVSLVWASWKAPTVPPMCPMPVSHIHASLLVLCFQYWHL